MYWESETHEWFHDKISTAYARKKSVTTSGEQDDALNVVCLITRNKETGDYDRVMMDVLTSEIIFDTKVLEDMAFQIDKMKLFKKFKMSNMDNDLELRCNFISVDFKIARNSYGEFFKIGDEVGHDSHDDGTAKILSFELDEESNEVKAHTSKGWSHLDFIFKIGENEE